MSTISPKRELIFDNVRGILIFLVVLGHALEYFRLHSGIGSFLYIFIYLFHMPVFVFISGYFSKNLQKGRQTAVKTFLIPYLLLNIMLSLILLAMGKIEAILILSPGWTLWFLYCMFIWRLLLPDLVKVRHVLILSLIVGIFSGMLTEFGTYMAMARTLGFLPYFLAGYFTTPEKVQKIRQFPFRKTLSLLIIGLGVATTILWRQLQLPAELLWGDRAYNLFDIPLWQNLLADIYWYALGFAFVFVFLALTTKRTTFFTLWGKHTLAIYLLHIYLIAPIVYLGEWISNPIMHLIFLVLGSSLTVYFLSRKKVTDWLSQTLDRIIHFIMKP